MRADTTRWEPVTKRAYEVLTWEWQDIDTLVRELAPLVAPGKALRKYQTRRTHYENRLAEQGGPEYRQRELTQTEKIESGQRDLARSALRTHTIAERAEVREFEGRKQVRLAVQVGHDGNCAGCGRPFSEGEMSTSPVPPKPRGSTKTKIGKTIRTNVISMDRYRKTS